MRRIDWNRTIQIDPDFRKEFGVVFACPFKERGGATVRDYSGNRYDGTLTNGPTRALDKWGGPALGLSAASSQHVNAGSWSPSTAFSWSLWVDSLVSASANYSLVIAMEAVDANVQWFTFGGSVYCRLHQDRDTTWIGRITSGGVSTARTHYAFTYDGTASAAGIKIYLNGVQSDTTNDNSGSFSAVNAAAIPTWIGAQSSGAGGVQSPLDGVISNVISANKAWTAEQVARIYRDPYAMYWQPSRHSFFVPGSSPPTSYATYLTLLGVG